MDCAARPMVGCMTFNLLSMSALAALLGAVATAQAADCPRISALEEFERLGVPLERSTCSIYQTQLGRPAISCNWPFPYRDKAAEELAQSLWWELQSCRAGEAQAADIQVNHPDSFMLSVWQTDDAIFRLSIKDKAGLGQTYVFLSYER